MCITIYWCRLHCSVSCILSMMRQMASRTECVSLSHPLHVTTNEACVSENQCWFRILCWCAADRRGILRAMLCLIEPVLCAATQVFGSDLGCFLVSSHLTCGSKGRHFESLLCEVVAFIIVSLCDGDEHMLFLITRQFEMLGAKHNIDAQPRLSCNLHRFQRACTSVQQGVESICWAGW